MVLLRLQVCVVIWILGVISIFCVSAGSTDTSLSSTSENSDNRSSVNDAAENTESMTQHATTIKPTRSTVLTRKSTTKMLPSITTQKTTTLSVLVKQSTKTVTQQIITHSTANQSDIIPTPTNQPPHHTSPARTDNRYKNLNRAMVIVFTPLGAVVVLGIFLGIGVYLRKKIRLDKLRHQLMPLYSFDPAAEDWETELLTEQRDINQVTTEIKSPTPTDSPKLTFSTETVEI
ncbi:uncharacterized protein LOC144453452 [Glandiceps talaboti]